MQIPETLIETLRSAERVAVLTGAGVSAESGVPTFRDAQTGLWAQYRPEDLATPQAFRRDPKLVWEWYAWRRELVGRVEPNPGHLALVVMERHVPVFHLITQNVDSLHQRAGSTNVVELHGNLARTCCERDREIVESWDESSEEIPPRCPTCGARLRPDVVWFGESLPTDALITAVEAARRAEVFLSVGTSAVVQPAASLPVEALQAGAVVVEINPDPTPLTPMATHALHGPSGEVLPEVVAAAWGEQ